jgi:dihydropteroate synthase
MHYSANGKLLTFKRPLVMAIVNITPDSFYDGGKYAAGDDVLRDVEEKLRQGADIIDIGAASSRPNAPEIDETTEWERLAPILPQLRRAFPDTFISVDTYRSSVAHKATAEGADIINDISAGMLDNKMFDLVARVNLPYIMMHMEGTPQSMSRNKPYEDTGRVVNSFLEQRIAELRHLGFTQIIIDPGFGFGKSLQNNYQLLKAIPQLTMLGYPLLAGISRKSMINKVIGSNPVTSLNGTTVLNTIALLNGAGILRVHDVAEAKQAIALVEYYNNA